MSSCLVTSILNVSDGEEACYFLPKEDENIIFEFPQYYTLGHC